MSLKQINIPWGKRIEGRIKVGCNRCEHIWWKNLENMVEMVTHEKGEIICEVIGGICPGCKRMSGHKVLEWERKGETKLDRWFD